MRVRYQIIAVTHARYKKVGKAKKGKILDEFVESSGYTRKYASWILAHWGTRVQGVIDGSRVVFVVGKRNIKPRSGRPKVYDDAFRAELTRLWCQFDCLCGKRFVAFLRPLVDTLRDLGELNVDDQTRVKLLTVSPATVDRLLKNERTKNQIKGSSLTRPGSLLKRQIPIRTFADWNDVVPGFLEADLVAHDGGSAYGTFLCTLTLTDVDSGWTEPIGILNKAQKHVFPALQEARQRLPFPVLGLDTDNGAEFLNHHLIRYCEQERITFTRSRPYRKNDNCFVEQKNNSVVRRSVGYYRFESEAALMVLNALYQRLRLLINFFIPSSKLLEKTRIGSKIVRRHDVPTTPYQRLLASHHVDVRFKEKLKSTYASLNPVRLAKEIHELQDALVFEAVRYTIPFRANKPQPFQIHYGASPRRPSSGF